MTGTLRGPADAEQFRMKVGRFGDRHYYDPLPADETWPFDGDADPYPSVSTIKKVTSRDFSPVAARRVAEYAVHKLDEWANVGKSNPEVAIEMLVGADRRGLSQAGQRGTAVHGVMENLAAGKSGMLNIDASAIPYVEACKAFIHDCNPTFLYSEFVAINRKYKYGGTGDSILEINGKRYLVDYKSRKEGSHAAYIEEAWQIAAYAKADYYIIGDENGLPIRVPPPPFDGGLIISICPGADSYRIYPVDLEKAWAGFVVMRSLWAASHLDQYKPLGKPVELCPRTYQLNLVPPLQKPPVEPEPWDPFAGLPTGDVAGTTHPVDVAPLPDGNATVLTVTRDADGTKSYDAFISVAPPEPPPPLNTWVEATWMQTFLDGAGRPLGPATEQRLEGWYVDRTDDCPVLADDNGNRTTLIAREVRLVPAEHPAPVGVVAITGGQQLDEGVVQPMAPVAPPSLLDAPAAPTLAAVGQDGGEEGDPEVRAWLRRRLASDIHQMGGDQALLRYWPPGIKPLDPAGKNKHTVQMLDMIEEALTNFEKDMSLPFGETKPGQKPEHDGALPGDGPVIPDEKEPRILTDAEMPAHPDDVVLMLERCMSTAKAYPRTWKNVEARSKEAGVPNLKRSKVTAQHLLDLKDIIEDELCGLEQRRNDIDACLGAMNDDMKVLIPFALGPDSDLGEPNADEELAISLLTTAASDGMLEINEQGELIATEGLMNEARKVFTDRVQLFRGVSPYLVKFGFSTVNTLDALRRRPLGIVMMLHHHKNNAD